jgi:hypothetical protein
VHHVTGGHGIARAGFSGVDMSRESNARYKQFNNAQGNHQHRKSYSISAFANQCDGRAENRQNGSAEPKPDSQVSQRNPPIADMIISAFVVIFSAFVVAFGNL